MAFNYRKIQNAFALGQVARTHETPHPSLAIGPAENLGPVSLMIYRNVYNVDDNTTATMPTIAESPIEKNGIVGQGTPIDRTDFIGGFYLGDPIGGTK